ncbi:UNC-44 ankyrin [Shewanella sp. NFH-SH190041]|uniref:ankyrin repeat domain-containing protein n=1 Tax=Shewanella sp. NFH-SH190041 TaxID=2950245 RepID=UPI0021C26B36|nr:ankyrin repeat domain-containing protein [Shewanella sp. NFH-SH190041]BDM64269.1 UNC-44 ankyrin [Shewanella sp. NFH-SH190041]
MTKQLLIAIESGHRALLAGVLEQQPELVNTVFEEHEATPFELALKNGFSKLADEIMNCDGFDLNHHGHNPLRLAIDLGFLDIAQALLHKGANPNYRPQQMSSALLLCLDNEYFELAELMVEKGAEVNIRNDKGWTPLIWASMKGRVKAVEFLLKHGAAVDVCNNDGWNAVTGAYFKQRLEVVDKLLAQGAVFSAKYSEAAMLSAFKNGHMKLAAELLENGVNPDVVDEDGQSLLILAIEKGDENFIKSVISAGANTNVSNSSSMTALSLLVKNSQDELISQLIVNGVDVNMGNKSFRSIHLAAEYDHLSTAKLLIENGADINALTDGNLSPLMVCAVNGSPNVARILLEKGANKKLKAPYPFSGDARHIANERKHVLVRNVIDEMSR